MGRSRPSGPWNLPYDRPPGSGGKRDFGCALTRPFSPELVVLRPHPRLMLEGRCGPACAGRPFESRADADDEPVWAPGGCQDGIKYLVVPGRGVELPIGIEPMTYASREACSRAAHALPALIAWTIALVHSPRWDNVATRSTNRSTTEALPDLPCGSWNGTAACSSTVLD